MNICCSPNRELAPSYIDRGELDESKLTPEGKELYAAIKRNPWPGKPIGGATVRIKLRKTERELIIAQWGNNCRHHPQHTLESYLSAVEKMMGEDFLNNQRTQGWGWGDKPKDVTPEEYLNRNAARLFAVGTII